jgi:ribonuclease P protein component
MSTFSKTERLTSRKTIKALINRGHKLYSYPFKIFWLVHPKEENSFFDMKVAFSVPKKKFKRAVTRNTLRRRMREAFRCHKETFKEALKEYPHSLSVLIIYTPHKETGYKTMEGGMQQAFGLLKKNIKEKTL